MSLSVLLARRAIARGPARLAAVAGVALALVLTLVLDAVYGGVAAQLTAYIDRAGADVWVAQKGVRNMHMVASSLPDSTVDEVAGVTGVAQAMPILYATDTINLGGDRSVAYVIGLPENPPLGGPWLIAAGAGTLARGQIVVDDGIARRAGVGVGDVVGVLGGEARVAGLSRGTATLVNTVAFVSFDDFRERRGGAPVVSYVLVRAAPGVSAEALAASIEAQVPGVTALSRTTFAAEERRLVSDMSAEVVAIMSVIGFFVALAVVSLIVYIAALAHRRDYGVLKAVGASNALLYRSVVAQAAMTVALGYGAALLILAAGAFALDAAGAPLRLVVDPLAAARAGATAAAVAVLSAILPILQIARVDPFVVFRRGPAQ